jgi:hypothetical protein
MRFSGVAEQGYTMLYGKSQVNYPWRETVSIEKRK